MKKIFIIFLLLIFSTPSYGQYISFTFQEKYIGLQSSRLISDRPMLWTEVQLGLPSDLYVGLWNAYGFESDITLGRNWKFFSASTSFLNFHPIKEWGENNVVIHSLRFSKKFNLGNHVLIPEARIEWLWRVESSRLTNGTLVLLPNIKHIWQKLFNLTWLSFSHRAMLSWDNGFAPSGNSNKGIFLRWSGGPEITVWGFEVVPVGWTILVPLTDSGDGRKFEKSLNFSVTKLF